MEEHAHSNTYEKTRDGTGDLIGSLVRVCIFFIHIYKSDLPLILTSRYANCDSSVG